MKNRHFGFLLAVLFLLATLVAGCGGAQTAGSKETAKPAEAPKTQETAKPQEAAKPQPKQTTYPITIKDGAGRDVTIKAEPKRIISVAPSNTELVFALGKGSVLVGRSDFDDYPAEAAKIESIGGFHPPNYEKIVSMKPDLILLIGGGKEAREKLENEYKLTTFVVDPQNFEQLYSGIVALGQVLNAQEKAEAVVADMKKEVNAIKEKAAKATTKPVVFYEVWHDPLMTAGPDTFIDDMIKIAGGANAAGAAKDRWPQFPLEQLAAANPDIIVTGSADAAKAAAARKGWESLKAVKNGKVLGVPDQNLVVRPGPRLVQGLKWFAETIHPEIFTK
ncbi:MAG: ABC transporter substrate-binding protein [Bacillota bacterium]